MTRGSKPLIDGDYLIIEKTHGIKPYRVTTRSYTVEGGWFTYRDGNGNLCKPLPHTERWDDDIIAFCKMKTALTPLEIKISMDFEDMADEAEDDLIDMQSEVGDGNEIYDALDYARDYLKEAWEMYRRREK